MKCNQLNQPFQTDIVPPVILHLLTREYHGGLTLGLTPGLPIQIYKENQPRSFSQKIRTLRELKRRGVGGGAEMSTKKHMKTRTRALTLKLVCGYIVVYVYFRTKNCGLRLLIRHSLNIQVITLTKFYFTVSDAVLPWSWWVWLITPEGPATPGLVVVAAPAVLASSWSVYSQEWNWKQQKG